MPDGQSTPARGPPQAPDPRCGSGRGPTGRGRPLPRPGQQPPRRRTARTGLVRTSTAAGAVVPGGTRPGRPSPGALRQRPSGPGGTRTGTRGHGTWNRRSVGRWGWGDGARHPSSSLAGVPSRGGGRDIRSGRRGGGRRCRGNPSSLASTPGSPRRTHAGGSMWRATRSTGGNGRTSRPRSAVKRVRTASRRRTRSDRRKRQRRGGRLSETWRVPERAGQCMRRRRRSST